MILMSSHGKCKKDCMTIICFSRNINKAQLIDNRLIKFYYTLHKRISVFEFLYSHLSNSWNVEGVQKLENQQMWRLE